MANAPAPKGWRNPAIVAAIIAAAVIVALIGLIPKPQTPLATPAHNVETSGGVAAGRNMHGNTITITGSDQRTAPAKKPEGN